MYIRQLLQAADLGIFMMNSVDVGWKREIWQVAYKTCDIYHLIAAKGYMYQWEVIHVIIVSNNGLSLFSAKPLSKSMLSMLEQWNLHQIC